MEHGKGTHNIRWLVVPVLVMEAQAVEKSVMERLSVLEGNQRQTLWRFLTAQCDQLDRRRAGRLSTALRTAESLKQHLQELRRPLIHSWIEDVLSNPLRSDMTGLVVPGALAKYDLPDLVRVLGERVVIPEGD